MAYLIDEDKNLVSGFTREEVLAILEQAIESGSLEDIDPNSAVASKLKSLINGGTYNIEFITIAEYNQLEAQERIDPNTYYFITDEDSQEILQEAINNLITQLQATNTRIDNLENRKQFIIDSLFINTDITGQKTDLGLPSGAIILRMTKIVQGGTPPTRITEEDYDVVMRYTLDSDITSRPYYYTFYYNNGTTWELATNSKIKIQYIKEQTTPTN